jgi:hypothetical protein
MQLEFDFLLSPEVSFPTPAPCATDAPTPDPDLGRFARARMAYSSVRERQGVVHRFALMRPELVNVAAELRSNAEAGDPAATIELVALLSGVPPESAGAIGLLDRCTTSAPVIGAELRTGQLHTDLGRICLGQAAQTASNGTTLPASHTLIKPLPRFLVDLLRQAVLEVPRARELGDLFPCTPPSASLPIAGSTEGRLRATHARARDGLSVIALALGLDNYDAALITNDFALIDKSRLFTCARIQGGCWKAVAACTPRWGGASQFRGRSCCLSDRWWCRMTTA